MGRPKKAKDDSGDAKAEGLIGTAHGPDDDEDDDEEDGPGAGKKACRHKFSTVIANPADPPKRQVCEKCGFEEALPAPPGFPGYRAPAKAAAK